MKWNRCFAALAAAFVLAPRAIAQDDPLPNVLVIVLDDLGTDKLQFYGETPTTCTVGGCTPCAPSAYPVTPALSSLRFNGILFTKAYANPLCSPTRACIQTGRYGFRTGIGTVMGPAGSWKLQDAEVFLPELLRDGFSSSSPYVSAAFGKWHLAELTGNDTHAVDNGYERFYGQIENTPDHFIWTKIEHDAGSSPVTSSIDGSATVPPYDTDTWNASVNRADAVSWINAQSGPFFAYVAFNPPHYPLQIPPLGLLSPATQAELACHLGGPFAAGAQATPGDPFEQRSLFFRAMIEGVDTEIGQLIAGIDEDKLANTTIIVIGDNGTPRGMMDDPPHDGRHAKGTVYDGGVRVPMIVAGPLVPSGAPTGGFTCDELVGAVDIWRTLADITAASETLAAPLTPMDSESFFPLILNPSATGTRTRAFSQRFTQNGVLALPQPSCYRENVRAITDGQYRYLRLQTSLAALPCGTATYTEELYDVIANPAETVNLIGSAPHAAILALLQADMTALSGN